MKGERSIQRCLLRFPTLGLACLCLLVGSVRGDAGQAADGSVISQADEHVRFIGVSRLDALPPLPVGARANLDGQPTNVPVPVFALISDEQIARGETRATTTDEPISAAVYRNSYDSGYGVFYKATEGNFVGNLLHLANGFPVDGGEISGYDLLVYNTASNPGGEATVYVSLWTGDPLGIIDTRMGNPPEEIAGTGCTFSGLVKGGTGSNGCIDNICDGGFLDGQSCNDDLDCGACPAGSGDDIPECPGLFRLECDFAGNVTIPSRNVWMIVQQVEGCRTGWRMSYFVGPQIAAVGEENFCAGTCPSAPVPCVDLIVEQVDAASQWDGEGVGTCCEDPGIACDHTDGWPLNDCGHLTTCSDGVAETFDAFCFGAPSYFAAFVASIEAPTTVAFSLVPVGGQGNEIWVAAGTQVELHIMMEGWDPDQDGTPAIRGWDATIDPSGYSSGVTGVLTPYTPPCTTDSDCPFHEVGSICVQGEYGAGLEPCSGGVCSCTAGFLDCPQPGSACFDMPSVNTTYEWYCWGSLVIFGPPLVDPGEPVYGGTLVLDVPPDADGTFTVDFLYSGCTDLRDQNNNKIPLLGFKPAVIHVAVCRGLQAPEMEPEPVTKNRYLSFVSGSSCIQTAHRVTFDDLPPPNDVLNGKTLWVGPPYQLSDNSGTTDDTPPVFTAAYLQCDPHYTDWSQYGTIHAYHRGIVPDATYTIQAIEEGCPVDDEGCYTTGLAVSTNKWGDIVGDCDETGCTLPNGIVDFTDIMSLVDKFRNLPLAVSKPRGDIGDELPDRRVGFIDVSWTVHTFQGGGYPFYVPDAADCP